MRKIHEIRVLFLGKIFCLAQAFAIVFCSLFGQVVADEVAQKLDSDENSDILNMLESALAHQRELLTTMTRENLIKMSGFRLDKHEDVSFTTKLNFGNSKKPTDEKAFDLINLTSGLFSYSLQSLSRTPLFSSTFTPNS